MGNTEWPYIWTYHEVRMGGMGCASNKVDYWSSRSFPLLFLQAHSRNLFNAWFNLLLLVCILLRYRTLYGRYHSNLRYCYHESCRSRSSVYQSRCMQAV